MNRKRCGTGLGRVLFVGVLVWSAVRSAAGQDEPAPKWTPFETIDQSALPIVSSRVNESDGFRLVVDPAVPENLLDATLVEGMGLTLASRGETRVIDYFGYRETAPVAYVELLSVGNVARGGVAVILIEGDDVTSMGGIRSYGRLGRAFLAPFRLTVYYPRRLLLLEPSPPGDVPAGGAPFDRESRFITVAAQVNGTASGRFVIDPGASSSVLDKKWALENGIAGRDARAAEMSSLVVGGFAAEKVPALIGELDKLPYPGKPVGVIGATLLLKTAITYDFPRGLVWLREAEGSEQ